MLHRVRYLLSIEIITPSTQRRRTWKEREYLSRRWRERREQRAHVILSSLFCQTILIPFWLFVHFLNEVKATRWWWYPTEKISIGDWLETEIYMSAIESDIVRSRSVLNNLWIEIYLVWYIERPFLRDKWEGIMKLKGRNGSELIWHFCVSN